MAAREPQEEDTGPSAAVAFAAGLLTLAALFGAATIGAPIAAGVCAVIFGLADIALLRLRHRTLIRYLEKHPKRTAELPQHATFLWLLAAALLVFGVTIVLFRNAVTFDLGDHRLWPYRGLAFTLAGGAGITHLSAVIDYTYILVHLRGLAGDKKLPCQREADWSNLTRLWLAHRLAAHIAVRVGLIALIGFGAVLVAPRPDHDKPVVTVTRTNPAKPPRAAATSAQPANTVTTTTENDNNGSKASVAGVLTAVLVPLIAALLVAFFNRFIPLAAIVSNPRLNVGDRIVLAEEFSTRSDRPPEYYVVDIAVEGVKLLELNQDGGPKDPAADGPGRPHDRSLDLVEIPRLLRFRGEFRGCEGTCSMANHNCLVGYGKNIGRNEKHGDAT